MISVWIFLLSRGKSLLGLCSANIYKQSQNPLFDKKYAILFLLQIFNNLNLHSLFVLRTSCALQSVDIIDRQSIVLFSYQKCNFLKLSLFFVSTSWSRFCFVYIFIFLAVLLKSLLYTCSISSFHHHSPTTLPYIFNFRRTSCNAIHFCHRPLHLARSLITSYWLTYSTEVSHTSILEFDRNLIHTIRLLETLIKHALCKRGEKLQKMLQMCTWVVTR